jgi:hypothetical protein
MKGMLEERILAKLPRATTNETDSMGELLLFARNRLPATGRQRGHHHRITVTNTLAAWKNTAKNWPQKSGKKSPYGRRESVRCGPTKEEECTEEAGP